ISSHLLSEIEFMCDRIGVIKNGELVAIQSVRDTTDDQQHINQVQMEVTPTAKAIELLKEHHDIDATLTDSSISFQSEKENITTIRQTEVKHENDVYQIEISKETIEDKFFDLIGENTSE